MANTPTTPASVASRLTDEEIERLAEQYELTASQTVATDSIRKHYTNSAAVLRDYVRMRRLENAVKNLLHMMSVSISTQAKVEAYENVRRLAEAEKGEAK